MQRRPRCQGRRPELAMEKVHFLKKLLDERTKFEHLVNRVHTSRLTISGAVGRWSVKDTLAHILAYEQYIVDRMAEITRDEIYHPCQSQEKLDAFLQKFGYPDFGSPLVDDNSANEWIVDKYRNVPLDEVVAHENQAFLSIVGCIEGLKPSQLDSHKLIERVASNTYEHYQEHFEQISAWLETVR